jgi:hypothetical protein
MPRKKMTDEEKAERDLKKKIKHLNERMEMDKIDCRNKDIPEPSYTHEIGDRVVYGAWNWTGILEKCDNGKFYKCFSISWKTNTNKPNPFHEHKIHYEPWFGLGFYRGNAIDDIERLEEDDDVRFQYMQRDLSSLLSMMVNKYGIDLEPEYQRGNIWSDEQRYDLIESVFRNIDIGKFAVIKRPWGPDGNKPLTPKLYEMLDGKQRLTALFDFYTGRFKYRGKYYYELHPRDQGHFKHYTISYAESSPLTKEQKYRYFLKLNVTGSPVAKEHLDKVRRMWENEKTKNNNE